MTNSLSTVQAAALQRHDVVDTVTGNMVWIPGGTFVMGSDRHYVEEAPAHRVTVDGFWIDRFPVTNDEFGRFVDETGHVTFAELEPNAADYPGALPDMLYAGSLVFTKPPIRVDLGNSHQWWSYVRGAQWRHPRGPSSTLAGLGRHPVVHVTLGDAAAYAAWAAASPNVTCTTGWRPRPASVLDGPRGCRHCAPRTYDHH